jgi:hypothetical protein
MGATANSFLFAAGGGAAVFMRQGLTGSCGILNWKNCAKAGICPAPADEEYLSKGQTIQQNRWYEMISGEPSICDIS